MRRSEREVTDINRIREILGEGQFCNIALMDGDTPYVVPMSYGWEIIDGQLRFYFHCAAVGKKLDCIAKNPNVAFSIAAPQNLSGGELPCDYTMYYRSVMGRGKIEVIASPDERTHAMTQLMKQHGYEGKMEFHSGVMTRTVVLTLICDSFTAKESLPPDGR